jgi:hypothetical protein
MRLNAKESVMGYIPLLINEQWLNTHKRRRMMISFRKLACNLLFATLALTAHNAAAQFPEPPPDITLPAPPAPPSMKRGVETEVSRMKELYHLSESQAGKIREILEDRDKNAQAISGDDSLSFRKRLSKL